VAQPLGSAKKLPRLILERHSRPTREARNSGAGLTEGVPCATTPATGGFGERTMTETVGAAAERASSRLGAEIDGKYRLEALLGVGGTAAVYAARHRNGHRVALKMLHPELAGATGMRDRFLREAYLANSLAHEGIVPILDDSVADDGSVYLIMELLDGESLGALARRQASPFTIPQVLAIAIAVLDVLAVAHDAGIVHRDIKPENIFLCRDGRVRVLDFGIARHVIATEAIATAVGTLLGTPAFMAPEQALGRSQEVGPLTDIWAVGATMWNLLTGRLVHEGRSAEEVLVYAATREARPLATITEGIDSRVATLVDRALSFESAARWPDAATMRAAAATLCPDVESAIAPLVGALPASRPSELPPLAPVLQRPRGAGPLPRIDDGPTLGPRRDRAFPPTSDPTATRTLNLETPSSKKWTASKKVVVRAAVIAASVALAALTVTWARVGPHRSFDPRTVRDQRDEAPAQTNADAAALFAAGVQLWHDASASLALQRFDAAQRADPRVAAAALYSALVDARPRPRVRAQFQRAVSLRTSLSPIQQDLLDAITPSMTDPFDSSETIRRLERLAASRPDDVDIALALLRRLVLEKRSDDASRLLQEWAPRRDVPALWSYRARVQLERRDTTGALASFERCIGMSTTAADCLEWSLIVQLNEGRCDAAEDLARRLVVVAPESDDGFYYLANAVFGETHSTRTTRAILEHRWNLLPPSERDRQKAEDEAHLALWDGKFDEADAHFREWESLVHTSTDSFERGSPAFLRMKLFLETGRPAEAANLARDYLTESAAWSSSVGLMFRIDLFQIRYRARDISRADFVRECDTAKAMHGTLGFSAQDEWYVSSACSVASTADAVEALKTSPVDPLDYSPLVEGPDKDTVFGRVYALAGHPQEALRYLERASGACHYAYSLYQVPASLLRGETLRDVGRVAESCDAFRDVVNRWSGAPQSVTVVAARSHLKELACSLEPPHPPITLKDANHVTR
jgi:serine/threonine protein kinase/tetratricopeptide (TPR) repeat protein